MKTWFIHALFIVLLFLPWLGLKQLHSRGEAREALVAQSMNLSGNYILPLSYSDLVPSKPPMLHWLMNIAAKLTGNFDEFAVRLPVALASILFAIFFAQFLRKLDFKNYWIPSLLLITSVQWFRHSNTARVDMLLSVGSVMAILDLYIWRAQNLCKRVPWIALFGLTIAVYSKGPIGIALPVIVFAIWCLAEKDRINTVILRCIIVSVPVCIVGTFWYLLAYHQAGQSFIDKFWYENAQRLAGTMVDEPHKGSVIYLYSSILWSMLPWSLFWIWPTITWVRNTNRISTLKNNIKNIWNRSSFDKLIVIWILTFVLFYSLPQGKRDVYLLPIMPAISILLANHLQSLQIHKIKVVCRAFYLLLWMVCGIVAIFGIIGFIDINSLWNMSSANLYSLESLALYFDKNIILICLVLLLSLFLGLVFRLKPSDTGGQLVTNIIIRYGIVLIIVQAFFAPAIGNAISYKNIATESSNLVSSDNKLFSYNDAFYGLSFYLKKPFYEIHPESGVSLPVGKYYLFENNLHALQTDLKPGQCVRNLSRSTKPMVDIKRFVLLVEVSNCGS